MRRRSNRKLGYYLPAFFLLHIETNEGLQDLDNLNLESKSTLYHEYVHFLQDLTTIYGLANTAQMVDLQKSFVHQILSNEEPEFNVPVEIDLLSPTGINMDLFELYEGDQEADFYGIQSVDNIHESANNKVKGYETIPSIIIEATDIFGAKKFFNFGAVCISESMAYLVEESMFDNVDAEPFPYHTAKKVCEFLHPDLAVDMINIICLCDIALNSSHPGKFFVDFIKDIKVKNFIPQRYTDFYDRYEQTKFTDINNRELSIYQVYKIYSDLANQQLKDYLLLPQYDSLKEWINQVFNTATDIRIKNFSFWLKVLDAPTKEERRGRFTAFAQTLGFPLMTNNLDEYYFSHPNIKTDMIVTLRAIYQVGMLLITGQEECQMKGFCRKSVSGDITSDFCNKPWKMSYLENTCSYGHLWRMWGLKGKVPISPADT